jgi:DNA-binding MarR family transcriptional regulator
MEPLPLADDVVMLLTACHASLSQRVLDETRSGAGPAVRHTDGYVFQHLLVAEPTITELARHLGVSQQAASKQVADLEQRGLVERRPDPRDARARRLALTGGGRAAVERARLSRERIAAEIVDQLGGRAAAQLRRALLDIAVASGAVDLVSQRMLRPEGSR